MSKPCRMVQSKVLDQVWQKHRESGDLLVTYIANSSNINESHDVAEVLLVSAALCRRSRRRLGGSPCKKHSSREYRFRYRDVLVSVTRADDRDLSLHHL